MADRVTPHRGDVERLIVELAGRDGIDRVSKGTALAS